jgi:hypothetical protein
VVEPVQWLSQVVIHRCARRRRRGHRRRGCRLAGRGSDGGRGDGRSIDRVEGLVDGKALAQETSQTKLVDLDQQHRRIGVRAVGRRRSLCPGSTQDGAIDFLRGRVIRR